MPADRAPSDRHPAFADHAPSDRHPAFADRTPPTARDPRTTPTRHPCRRRRSVSPARALTALATVLVVAWIGLGRPTTVDALVAALPGQHGTTTAPAPAPAAAAPLDTTDLTTPPADVEGPFRVVRVVDGDTLIVARPDGETRVRLIGIDTPESVAPDRPVECFGPEASARTTELLAGQTVTLRGDPTQDSVDQYGRELDYVWLPDGRLLNHVLVAEGFAVEHTYAAPYAYQQHLRDAQQQAQDAGAGLWSATTCGGVTG
jgi:micrococcal nuclease